ncbi:MAG: AAA family ATPase [Chloroflexota bacterium]|nr:AAA family ATPase [Chloroflexota bacterium]
MRVGRKSEEARMQVQQLINQLSTTYVERSETIEPLVAAVIARRHVVLIGPPGTAKSSLVRDLAAGLGGLRFFSWLLTEFSVPEELFGPLDISALEQGQYRRLTAGKLPNAELAFIDEVFKAGPAILNTLLSVMQERLFYNDGQPTPVPLVSLIGASNETPTGEQELEALWDRFTVRLQVGYIQEPGNFVRMLTGSTGNAVQVLSRADLEAAQEAAARVPVPGAVLDMTVQLRQVLSDHGIVVSDRRYKESLDLLRAVAFLDGRDEVIEDDLLILQHVLWHNPSQAAEVARLVFAVAEPLLVGIAEVEDEALAAVTEARQVLSGGTPGAQETQQLLEAVGSLRETLKKLEALEEQIAGRPKAAAALERTHDRVKGWQAEVLKALGV